jgi:AraC-like DNA-binding protein
MFDTKQTEKSTFQPNIIFTSLFFQGEQEPRPILNRQMLTINKDQRNLTIWFAALDYSDHFLTEYAYCMDGAEEWNYIGTTPRISFNQLSPGTHTLRVKSTNVDGVWGSQVATLYLDVTPTLWERTWVRIAVLLLTIIFSTAAILDFIRYRQKNREREKRLENILQQYRELQQTVAEQERVAEQQSSPSPPVTSPITYRLETPHVVDEDQEMMQKLMKFIEEHVDDDGLRIDDMAQAVGLGRSVFYERLKSLVGVSPIDFLRQLRMQRAKELIKRSSMNVSQVAYAVGFTDPKYFTKCFKKETGMTPSEYREKGV